MKVVVSLENEFKDLVCKIIIYLQRRYSLRIKKIILADSEKMRFQKQNSQNDFYWKKLSTIARDLNINFI